MNTVRLNIVNFLFSIIPETQLFKVKANLIRWAGAQVGENVRICSSVRIYGNGSLSIGDDVWIGHQCLLISTSNIVIGSHIDMAPRVYIGTGTHEIDKSGLHSAGEGQSLDVRVEDGVWLCANSCIMPGVTVAYKSVVAAGATLISSTEAKCIYGGTPARHIKKI